MPAPFANVLRLDKARTALRIGCVPVWGDFSLQRSPPPARECETTTAPVLVVSFCLHETELGWQCLELPARGIRDSSLCWPVELRGATYALRRETPRYALLSQNCDSFQHDCCVFAQGAGPLTQNFTGDRKIVG